MKRFLLALAAITLFLTTAVLPTLADGNPESKCYPKACSPFHPVGK